MSEPMNPTIEVRIAVVVGADGSWSSACIRGEDPDWDEAGEDPGDARYVLIAELELPDPLPVAYVRVGGERMPSAEALARALACDPSALREVRRAGDAGVGLEVGDA